MTTTPTRRQATGELYRSYPEHAQAAWEKLAAECRAKAGIPESDLALLSWTTLLNLAQHLGVADPAECAKIELVWLAKQQQQQSTQWQQVCARGSNDSRAPRRRWNRGLRPTASAAPCRRLQSGSGSKGGDSVPLSRCCCSPSDDSRPPPAQPHAAPHQREPLVLCRVVLRNVVPACCCRRCRS
jgi:hypothetical protein